MASTKILVKLLGGAALIYFPPTFDIGISSQLGIPETTPKSSNLLSDRLLQGNAYSARDLAGRRTPRLKSLGHLTVELHPEDILLQLADRNAILTAS